MRAKIYAAIAVAVLLTGRMAMAAPEDDGILRIGGSTTLLPVISKIASDYMGAHKSWAAVAPGLPNKDIQIFVTGGGSGFGVKGTLEGAIHIGLVSRDLKDEEKRQLGDPRLFLVGKDAVAIAVSADSPLAKSRPDLSFADIAAILAGEKKTLRDIDPSLPAQEIALFVRDASAGSAEVLQDVVLKTKQVSPAALQMPSQGALVRRLESTPRALGYVSSGLALNNKRLHAFSVEGVAPTNDNVLNGKYRLVRPLYLVVRGAPSPVTQRFIDYVLSDGQKIVAASDYVPARDAK